ncbi:MAG: hypothetical protein FIA99_10145 [Ruminiclostridium sp.]|nr:hypothetical protein [Ruminiclostridium sp.]
MVKKSKVICITLLLAIMVSMFGVGIFSNPAYAADATSYEAEASSNTFSGLAAVRNYSEASAGQYVDGIGYGSSNYLIINNVYAASAGAYTIGIAYRCGGTRTLYYSVNGGAGNSVTVSGINWNPILTTSIVVNLNSGNNTIKFYNNSDYAPDIDRIMVSPGSWGNISRDYYDWSPTKAPERSYMMDYTKNIVMKLRVASVTPNTNPPYESTTVHYTFEQTLDLIKQVDKLTDGAPKIIYLVGWQFSGHDSKYPSWAQVNPSLKRAQDANGWDSLRWLMGEAKKYNTTVSLHINMLDAYQNSPDWSKYYNNDLLSRNADGTRIQRYTWDGGPAYWVNYKKEWDLGFAKSRIDDLIAQLPADLHTIHIDVFASFNESPFHGTYAWSDTIEGTQRQILRYWRDKGYDVTNEYLSNTSDHFLGLRPAMWWTDLGESEHLSVPASLLAAVVYPDSSAYLRYLFGNGVHGEELFGNYGDFYEGSTAVTNFKRQFGNGFMQLQYLNPLTRQSITGSTEATKVATFSDGVQTSVANHRMQRNGVDLKYNDDSFIPVRAWTPNSGKEIIAFSTNGYTNKTWTLPPEWSGTSTVDIYTITSSGLSIYLSNISVSNNTMTFSLGANQLVSVRNEVQADLSGYFNQDGFSYDSNRADGAFGEDNWASYSADLVTTTPTYDGTAYRFGPMTNGSINEIKGTGQVINLTQGQYTSIRMLGAATNGDWTGTFTVTYTDSSTSQHSVTMEDWCKGTPTGMVEQTMAHRHLKSGSDQTINTRIYAYYITPTAGKTVKSITMPNNANMHVIAISMAN